MVKIIKTQCRIVVARGQKKGEMGSYCLMGTVSCLQDEEFWRWVGGGDGRIAI